MNDVPSPLRENPYPQTAPQAPQGTFTPVRFPVTHPYAPNGLYAAGGSVAPSAERATGRKIRVAFLAAVLFVALSYNGVYRVVDTVYGAFTGQPHQIVAVDTGAPTLKGVLVHAAVFFVAVIYLLR